MSEDSRTLLHPYLHKETQQDESICLSVSGKDMFPIDGIVVLRELL